MHAATRRNTFFSLFFALLLCGITAGVANAEPSKVPFAINGEPTNSLGLALGDMDGDGDLDVAFANKSVPSQVYRNDGVGNFTLAWQQSQFVAEANDVKWGDLDGDGDLDLVFVYKNAANQVYRNDVNQHPADGALFVPAWQSPTSGVDTRGLAIGDLDGDGWLDLVFVTASAGTEVFANDHRFGFSLVMQSSVSAEDVDLADMDGNGYLDLALAAPSIPVLRNMGDFVFDQMQISGPVVGSPVGIRWGDAENDGDLDLVVVQGSIWDTISLYRNTAGSFARTEVRSQPGANYLSGLAWEDYDNDGDLDIILSSYRVLGDDRYIGIGCLEVLANDRWGNFALAWDSRPDQPGFSAVVLGDLDQDGDLDLAGSTDGGWLVPSRSRYYRQDVNFLMAAVPTNASIGSGMPTWPRKVVVADLDKDNDLDVAATLGDYYALYRNDGVLNFVHVGNSERPAPNHNIQAIAAGDMDLDGDVDLALGFSGSPIQILCNEGNFRFVKVWEAPDPASTFGLMWTDMDGDGPLDLIAANYGAKSTIYRNLGNASFSLLWSDAVSAPTVAVAVHDVDGDGDSDVAFGRDGQPAVVLRNNGTGQLEPLWAIATSPPHVSDMIFGDLNGDGLPDLVIGDRDGGGQVLQNLAGVQFVPRLDVSVDDTIASLALGDVDADHDLDLALVGNKLTSSVWVLENNADFRLSVAWRSPPKSACHICVPYENNSAVWADMDGDGALDLIVVGDTTGFWESPETMIYRTTSSQSRVAKATLPMLAVQPPNSAGATNGGVGRIADQPVVAMPLALAPAGKAPPVWLDAEYSVDGGGSWQPALAVPNAWRPGDSTYRWDTASSGFLGQSDYVVLRLRALTQSPVLYPLATLRYTNTVAGPFQYAPRVSVSTPFRMRGTQVQVLGKDGLGVAQAIVYKLEEAGRRTTQLMADGAGVAFRTTPLGWLQGRDDLKTGNELAALYPVSPTEWLSFTQSVDFYYTSAAPTTHTLAMQPVKIPPSVQVLTVTVDNKLLVVNLDVALEWDARKDVQFMEVLKFNLQRASDLLFDWTNGQAALGQVRIFQDAKRYPAGGINPWEDSHIRIYASNRMRPNAAVGGIISPTLLYTEMVTVNGQTKEVEYGPGQVHMGAIWNRYGETSGNLGDDWARALAHELGHYVFFLEDNYLGLDEHGLLVTVKADGDQGCPGVMNDPYRDDQSEFHPFTGWDSPGCQNTLSQRSSGRADWTTITQFYHLNQPAESFAGINQGPNIQPLAVTQLQEISPTAAVDTLDVPIFTLLRGESEGGGTYLPSANAQAFLFQGGWLTDLGQPTLDQLQAWGARVGKDDRLCLLEPGLGYYGCEQVQADNTQLTVEKQQMWQPEIVVSSVNSYTIAVSGTMPPISDTVALNNNFQVCGRLYPVDEPAQAGELVAVGAGAYAHTFALTKTPTLEGYVHVWILPAGSSCAAEPVGAASLETVTSYAVGGNPIHRRARRTSTRGDGVHRRARRVPVISADGQVMIFGDVLDAATDDEQEWSFTLQAIPTAIELPPGRTLVGQAYRLTASPGAPDLSGTSISFGYLGEQVPPGEEGFLRIYFWQQDASVCQPLALSVPCWQPLYTFRDLEYNVASAKTQGVGLYALMASMEIPLSGPGWNNFAYPVPYTQTVPSALASLDGYYTIVYGYRPEQPDNEWSAYGPTAPEWANDLKQMEFGRGYLIYTTDAITLYLSSEPAVQAAAVEGLTLPPAAIYGVLQPIGDFTPAPGMEVTAWIGDKLCGRSQVQTQNGQEVYVVKVMADNGGSFSGCGLQGRAVRIQVGDTVTVAQTAWDNTRMTDTSAAQHLVFLPLASR